MKWKKKYLDCMEEDFFQMNKESQKSLRDHRGDDRMVVGFTTTHAISAYHH
jgi:hypothetical protein